MPASSTVKAKPSRSRAVGVPAEQSSAKRLAPTKAATGKQAARKPKPGSGALLGYARVSTAEQDPALQLDALRLAGCVRVFTDRASGSRVDRPELAGVLDQLRGGDTLVVWRLDRLGRSLRHLIDTVTALDARGVGFRSLTEAIDTTTAGGRLVFHLFGALAEFSVISTRRALDVPAVGAAA